MGLRVTPATPGRESFRGGVAAVVARKAAWRGEGDQTVFELLVVPRGGQVPQLTKLVLHTGPGDQGEPVATLMLPGED